MPNRKYHPDYNALYPGVELSAEVARELKKSDRKMEYFEQDLKHGRFIKPTKTRAGYFLPSREDSLERLLEANWQFMGQLPSPEEQYLLKEEKQMLAQCLAYLSAEEQELIDALFRRKLTEQQCAAILGIAQQNIHKRKKRILYKLLKMLERGC